MQNRRFFLKAGAVAGAGLLLPVRGMLTRSVASVPEGILRPKSIPKFTRPLAIPPAMPRAGQLMEHGALVDYYEIALRQFDQEILPPSMDLEPTTVWGYGAVNTPSSFTYPASTIEARVDRPVRVQWINGLINHEGHYRKHLLAIDQTLHWANPPGGMSGRDGRGSSQHPYSGPVPMVPHVHGAHARDHSDGYAEAWFLPAAANIPAGFARNGTWYEYFKTKFQHEHGVTWAPGTATYQYENDQRATTLWFHDHSLGLTRANVYAGPAGFYLLRGGAGDAVTGRLPGPAPALGDAAGQTYYEIPIVIQDRTFDEEGALFYPDNRAFFEGLSQSQLQIPFIPDTACGGPSDVSPIWNAEFFGNSMVVNGGTWPHLNVEQRRYRFRILNGCNARFLILKLSNGMPICQIGAEGGFLPAPINRTELLLGPAERADVIVDFTHVRAGTELVLLNLGPDEPFGGGAPGEEFAPSDPKTTGQVMMFRVRPARSVDSSTPGMDLVLPARIALGTPNALRQVSINELESATVRVVADRRGRILQACSNPDAVPFGPTTGLLGILNMDGSGIPVMWEEAVTENPALGSTEIWEFHNFTEDAHPIHLHQTQFEVVNRQAADGAVRGPEIWETGLKDTVVAYPGEITRVKAFWDLPGRYVWHCHILEHEDNEMMRPLHVGPIPA